MKKAKEIARKILRKFYTGLGLTAVALVFQACYGPPQAIGLDTLIRGVVKSKKTKEPISGIKVSVDDVYQYEMTDSSGKFMIYVPQGEICTIRFDDIDGMDNGSYLPKELPVDVSKDKIDLEPVLLDDAE
jgi:hypothetical protein